MRKPDLHPYALNARARADELLDLLDETDLHILETWLTEREEETWGNIVILSPRTRTILAQTPAKDQAWKQKGPPEKFLREWAAARYWAILSARALSIAADLSHVPGEGYREAVRSAAPVADKWLDLPDQEELLTARLLG